MELSGMKIGEESKFYDLPGNLPLFYVMWFCGLPKCGYKVWNCPILGCTIGFVLVHGTQINCKVFFSFVLCRICHYWSRNTRTIRLAENSPTARHFAAAYLATRNKNICVSFLIEAGIWNNFIFLIWWGKVCCLTWIKPYAYISCTVFWYFREWFICI